MENGRVPFRIRIGITGHRRLDDPDRLRREIQAALFGSIAGLFRYPTDQAHDPLPLRWRERARAGRRPPLADLKTPLAFSILTPLAEGADRLAAEEILKLPGSTIEVVLPLAKSEYLEDFAATPGSAEEFERLFRQARRPITLRSEPLDPRLSPAERLEKRREAYEAVGRYVVDHCDLLLALWDGQPARGRGGTAEIIEYARRAGRPLLILSTTGARVFPPEPGLGMNRRTLERVEAFNASALDSAELSLHAENAAREIFGPDSGAGAETGLPGNARTRIREHLLPGYARASQRAKKAQKFFLRVGSLVYGLSTGAIALVVCGIFFPAASAYAFLAEFGVLAAILALVLTADAKRTQQTWIENRFLAERIRMSVFFASCGLEMPLLEVPPTLREAHRPDDWMIKIFDELWNGLPLGGGCPLSSCGSCRDFVLERWIREQIRYHRKKSASTREKSRRLERLGLVLFFIAMGAALAHVLRAVTASAWGGEWAERLLVLLALLLPAAGASLGGIRSHREYSRISKRSRNMEAVLTGMADDMKDVQTPADLERLMREAHEIMLRETQDWLMLMRFVELKPQA